MPDPGDSLAHFRLLVKIGEGGTGGVWKAVDTKLDREVALKILPSGMAENPERLAQFKCEAKAVAALNHPSIVTIHSVEEADGVHFLTMELVDGATLAERIPLGGLDAYRFLDLALPLTDAVRAAHERGITHRDLKPGNIMISKEGRVKVLDFGLARFRGDEEGRSESDTSTTTLTREGEIRGTMPYMSPEQLQGKPLDHRTDLFSLGVVFYEMVTGRRPFEGQTSADLIASILRDEPRSPTARNPKLPARLETIVERCLAKDRGRRPQTAQELHDNLSEVQAEITAPMQPPAPTADVTSIAVLPLENLSGDPRQEFFADGMTDVLITDLAKIGGLRVISRTSIMQYKGARKPLREIAGELGVGKIVEGSVLRAGDRVRIVAQLIDASTDEHLWAERYDRELKDVLALQGEVAQAIASQIHVELTTQEQERLCEARPVHPQALEACLLGRHFWHRRTAEAVKKGLAQFERAVELDPGYAPAWAGIADSYLVDGGRYLGVPREEAYPEARRAALKAVELDDGLAEAHTSVGAVKDDFEWDWAGAEAAYHRAIELNPGYATAHYWYADHLSRMGRHEEARHEVRLAQQIDPLSLISNLMVAWVQFFARRYEEAIEQARKTLELDTGYVAAYRVLGWACEEMKRFDEAIEAHRTAATLSSNHPSFMGQLGRALALAGRGEDARKVLKELDRLSRDSPVSGVDVAIILAALGETDRAFEALERALEGRDDHFYYLAVNPRLDGLRGDPRMARLLARSGLVADEGRRD